MKLIQENNTLYIVEGENKYKVSEESKYYFINLYNKEYDCLTDGEKFYISYRELCENTTIDITDIKHRIEIREVRQVREDNNTFIGNQKQAFLLPEKEEPNVLITDPNSPRNWTEDYERENGKYTCFCRTCNNTFLGYKRRLICKVCSNKEDNCDGTCATNECICDELQDCLEIVDKKTYSIEQIEKAIDKSGGLTVDKQEIINNLKKS